MHSKDRGKTKIRRAFLFDEIHSLRIHISRVSISLSKIAARNRRELANEVDVRIRILSVISLSLSLQNCQRNIASDVCTFELGGILYRDGFNLNSVSLEK